MIKILLTGLSGLYFVGYQIDKRFKKFRMEKLNAPVISIGNLELGGTGKTQLVIWLVGQLIDRGKKIAILSRGYKGKYRGIVTPSTVAAGDEVLMLAQRFKNYSNQVATCADPNRVRASRLLAKQGFIPDLYILDDGFQQYQLHRDLDILLIDAQNPRADGLIPRGRLREPFNAISRADLILFTRCQSEPIRNKCLTMVKPQVDNHKKILFSDFKLDKIMYEGKSIDWNYRYFLVTAIGKPQQLLTQLKSAGVNIVESVFFRDHHKFTSGDIEKIKIKSEISECDYLLMTEKDRVKVNFPVAVCHSSIQFYHQDEHILKREVLKCLN